MAKEKEVKFKSYFNQDSIMLLKSAIATEQEEFAPFDIKGRRISFDRVVVNTFNEYPVLEVQEDYGKEYMRQWNINVGRLLCKDIRRGNFDAYYELITADLRAIVRMLSPEDVASGAFTYFDTIAYGDKSYVIMKIVGANDGYYKANINEILSEAVDPEENISDEDDCVNENSDEEFMTIAEIDGDTESEEYE